MAPLSRATLLTQVQKVLKKHYDPVLPDANRSVLEHVIYGLLLENTAYATADAVIAALRESYFDWNEVRVAAASDLTEQLQRLPDPALTAASLRGVLQAVFDTTFSFDLEHLRKENLGKAIERLERFKGSRPFMVSYVVQAALGGHSIPLDRGAVEALAIVGLASPPSGAAASPGTNTATVPAGAVPGLERAVPKNKGLEFASLLHQLSAEYVANPYSPSVHKVLLEINPASKERLPKRGKKPDELGKEPRTAGTERPKSRSSRPAQAAKEGSKKPASAGARRKPR